MPSISEILAARKAAAAATAAPAVDLLGEPTTDRVVVMTEGPHYAKLVDSTGRFIKWLPKPDSITERIELREAIDRIDPRGKHRTLVLTEAPAPEPAPLPNTPPEPELRSLASTAGELVPMGVPAGADALARVWDQAANSLETELCLMQDPADPEVAWLALRPPRQGMPPLLLHRLPWLLWPAPADPF